MVNAAEVRILLGSAYSTADVTDETIQAYIDLIKHEVADASARHKNIAGCTLNIDVEENAIRIGTCAMTLKELQNKGASQGLQAQRIIVSADTMQTYYIKYHEMLNNMRLGTIYGI